MTQLIKWNGKTTCDLCNKEVGEQLHDGPHFIPQMMRYSYATTCDSCWKDYREADGLCYKRQPDGSYAREIQISEEQEFVMNELGLSWDEVMDM